MHRWFVILVVSALIPTASATAQQLGPGHVRPRPGEGREPEFPPPTIIEYQPRSTLIVPVHLVPRAKFPVVDFHGHPPALVSADVIDRVGGAMDSLNLQVMVNASGSSGHRLTQQIEAVRASHYRDRFVMFTTLNLRNVGPGSGAAIAAQLEADVKAGAVGVGEIGKGFGLAYRKTDGTRLNLDDPELDPVWETAARLKIPVFIHVADPAEFFEPIDYHNERWLELALFPDRRYHDRSKFPTFEELGGGSGIASSRGTRAPRASFSSSIRIASCLGKTRFSPMSIPTTGGCSRPMTSTSTTTATIMPLGKCTAWGFPIRY